MKATITAQICGDNTYPESANKKTGDLIPAKRVLMCVQMGERKSFDIKVPSEFNGTFEIGKTYNITVNLNIWTMEGKGGCAITLESLELCKK